MEPLPPPILHIPQKRKKKKKKKSQMMDWRGAEFGRPSRVVLSALARDIQLRNAAITTRTTL